ncbi:hypothetical protein VEx25_A0555 [Vibrio antiquarius]|uniref:Uncharacterized protein n=1 Tax=Vibrio antiquarius (strain Ex25) TaxID=150340 RepID=A0ABM9WT48_VIBAE|nr:hypothetical protein VEx25_A0555 [Vibrio antiquarius]
MFTQTAPRLSPLALFSKHFFRFFTIASRFFTQNALLLTKLI